MSTQAPSQFYSELMSAIDRAVANGREVNYRQSVLAMGLNDTYCGKIKHGTYVPSKDRLHQLARYLGVQPTEFTAFIKRYADERLDLKTPDNDIFATFRAIASLPEPGQKLLTKALRNYAERVQAESAKAV